MKCKIGDLKIGEKYIFINFGNDCVYFKNFEIITLDRITQYNKCFEFINRNYNQGILLSWLENESVLLIPYENENSLKVVKVLYGESNDI